MELAGDASLPMRALASALMNKAAAMFGGSHQRCTQRKTQRSPADACSLECWQAGRALAQDLVHRA